MKYKKIALSATLLMLGGAVNGDSDVAWSDENIDALIARMTLEEKVLLTSGRDPWSTQPIDRLDIPYIWVADGPHGLRRAPTTDTWGYGDQLPATCFPTASALSATWDTDLVREVGSGAVTSSTSRRIHTSRANWQPPTSTVSRPRVSVRLSSTTLPITSKRQECGRTPMSTIEPSMRST
jgi:hypothetical protein